jgi:hypothetical protein
VAHLAGEHGRVGAKARGELALRQQVYPYDLAGSTGAVHAGTTGRYDTRLSTCPVKAAETCSTGCKPQCSWPGGDSRVLKQASRWKALAGPSTGQMVAEAGNPHLVIWLRQLAPPHHDVHGVPPAVRVRTAALALPWRADRAEQLAGEGTLWYGLATQ